MYFSDEFVVKFKETVSQQQIDEIHEKYLVEIKEDPYQYLFEKTRQLLSVPVDVDVLEIANAYQESGLVVYSQPNFIAEVELNQSLPYDPYFNNQFYLRNTGQGVNGRTSTAGVDINVVPAWSITKGSPNIVVAVIDEGITSNHPDLPNTRQIRLNGSNFGTGNANDPSPTGNDNHGNACVGIIAASHNGEGVAGIAPYCKILPIRIPYGTVNQAMLSKYAAAIRLAAKNADVISNSWSIGTNNPNYSAEIVDAIIYATTSGRRGSRGSVVVFAASNSANHVQGNNGIVAFPANVNISGVLTVGAIDRNGQQANYSPTSNTSSSQNQIIDVVAPSHKAYSSQISSETFDVWSIDIPGPSGYNPTQYDPYNMDDAYRYYGSGVYIPNNGTNRDAYTGLFGGTSAAAPQVAGVAALILSQNPNLTQQQVMGRILSTASNTSWNSQTGYGVVNAYAAVNSAFTVLTGPDVVCTSGSAFTVSSPPSGYTWTYSSNLTAGTSSGNSRTFSAANSNVSGEGWIAIKGNNGAELTRKTVWVGKPPVFNIECESGYNFAAGFYTDWNIFMTIPPGHTVRWSYYSRNGGVAEINNLWGGHATIRFIDPDYYSITAVMTNACGSYSVYKDVTVY